MTSTDGVEGSFTISNYNNKYIHEWSAQNSRAGNSVFTATKQQNKEKKKIEYDKNGYPKIVVQSGETPKILAKKFGCSAQAIIDANKKAWNGKFFKVGQTIVIPKHINEDNEELQNRKTKEEAINEYIDKLNNPSKGKKAEKQEPVKSDNNTENGTITQIDEKQENTLKATNIGFTGNYGIFSSPQTTALSRTGQTMTSAPLQFSPEAEVARNDAIPDLRGEIERKEKIESPFISSAKPEIKTEARLTGWKGEFQEYQPTNQVKYNRVLNRIKKNKNLSNKGDAKYIANMVCTLSDRYGLDPEITVSILERESQFNFTPRVMVHKGSQYKGVMQVNPEIIRCMYANPKDANNKKLTLKQRKEAGSHVHYAHDDARISELKTKYPTPEKLYEAIQKDVALGIEVGIMAYKASLSMNRGSTTAALAQYCGNQYKFPADSLNTSNNPIPRKIYPIPQYKA